MEPAQGYLVRESKYTTPVEMCPVTPITGYWGHGVKRHTEQLPARRRGHLEALESLSRNGFLWDTTNEYNEMGFPYFPAI
jgi:hypothetical protein